MENLKEHEIQYLSHSSDGKPHKAFVYVRDNKLYVQPFGWDDTVIITKLDHVKTDLIIA